MKRQIVMQLTPFRLLNLFSFKAVIGIPSRPLVVRQVEITLEAHLRGK